MTMQLYIEDVALDDALPLQTHNASRAQLFLYSAATWNPHRIHYDADYARFEGHPDIIVHGPLQGAWFTQYVTDWAGPRARIVSAKWQNRASAPVETEVRFTGQVTGIDGNDVSLQIEERSADGQLLMPGVAVVRLPDRPADI